MNAEFWTGVRHFFRIGSVQLRLLGALLWIGFRRKIGLAHSAERLERIHRCHARRFKRVASSLKGANVKVGQLISLQAHIF